jgi:Bacteriophage probable baseplate hub protein
MPRVPFYNVKVEGHDITPWVDSVAAIEDDRQADSVTVSIPDPRMIYADALFEGSSMDVDLGYAESGQHALIIRAVVTKVEVNYPDNGTPKLTLKGEDRSILMGLKEQNKYWRNLKVTEIVTKIAKSYGFKTVQASLSNDPVRKRPIHQDGKTDLQFVQDLAKKYHARCFVELDAQGDEVFYFIPERRLVTLNRPNKIILTYRMGPASNLISFSPSFDSSYIDRKREVYDIDRKGNAVQSRDSGPTQEVIWKLDKARMAQANQRDTNLINTLYQSGANRKKQLAKDLHARRKGVGAVAVDQSDTDPDADTFESRRLGMTATGLTMGNIWLRSKTNVFIHGASERFDGGWYVSRVTNRVDGNGFKTEFKCVR